MVGKSKHPMYKRWKTMKHRCVDKYKAKWCSDKCIKVCKSWLTYDNFYKLRIKNGFQSNLDPDRIDDTKGYCPSNCQFISPRDNIRTNKLTLTCKWINLIGY